VFDVYASPVGEDGYFGPGVLVPEFSSPGRDTRIFIRKDGLEVFITSDRRGGQGLIDIWTSTRETLADGWSTPLDLAFPVNTAAFLLSATSPRRLSLTEISTSRIEILHWREATVFQTVAFERFGRKTTRLHDASE